MWLSSPASHDLTQQAQTRLDKFKKVAGALQNSHEKLEQDLNVMIEN